MAPKASKILARTRVAEFNIPRGEEVDDWKIEYRPFSEASLRRAMQESRELPEDEQFAALRLFLSNVIVEWNLTDDEGQPIPFDANYLSEWGFDYVREIQEGLVGDMQGPKASSTPSSGRLALVATA